MAKTKEELREARKQWFAQMEQKLQEMHTKEEDWLFYCHSSEDRIVLACYILDDDSAAVLQGED